MRWRTWPVVGFATAMLLGSGAAVDGKPPHKRALADYFGPLLPAKLNDCRTCHLPEKPGEETAPLAADKPHNRFGDRLKEVRRELRKAGKKTDIPTRLEATANEDSDGDRVANLVELLTGHNPGDPHDRPDPKELAQVDQLIAAFAKAQRAYRWKPFESVQRPPVPRVKSGAWVRNPVDAFLAAEHEERGLRPRPQAAKHILLRRVHLDLIGLPPRRAELHAFLADQSPDAYEKVVDKLLASPHYGERWGRHWMDVWRYSDWYGFGQEVRNSQRHIWRWRDWILESLNADKGYDRMVCEMLAGDELAPEDPQTVRATGFLIRNWYLFNRNTWLQDTIEHTGKAFLGVTMNCARCHDHFFDPIAHQEYYAFRALFEPYGVRTDRVPGQADVAKDGLAQAYDADPKAETYLFVRGDERNPDKSQSVPPGLPAALGGPELRIEPVQLPRTVSIPDKRDFVIQEVIAESAQAIVQAKNRLETARQGLSKAQKALAAAGEADRETHFKLLEVRQKLAASAEKKKQALPEEVKPLQEMATKKVEELVKSQLGVLTAQHELDLAQLDVPLAEANHAALLATLRVERLEDSQGNQADSPAWQEAAAAAGVAQRHQAVLDARRNRLVALRAVERAQARLTGAADTPAERKEEKNASAALQKAAADLVEARAKLAEAERQLAQAEQAEQLPPAPVYTKRKQKTYPTTSTGRRLALARWITDRQNPLTARVAMNHIWLRHFGKALVPTVFDFGRNGQPPTHPALLDWLAAEFMDQKWSMKAMHRLLVTSNAYRRDSTADPANLVLDSENRYLWRMNSRRLEAELVRDSVLAVAGQLDSTMGGPDLPHTQGLTVRRRSVYFQHASERQMEFLTLFDAANVNECYARTESVIPQQALALANSSLVLAQARLLARNLSREIEGQTPSAPAGDFVDAAFEHLLGRPPSDAERTACAKFLTEQAARLADTHKLTAFTAGSANPVPPAGDPQLRARESLIGVLLNHHEFVTIR